MFGTDETGDDNVGPSNEVQDEEAVDLEEGQEDSDDDEGMYVTPKSQEPRRPYIPNSQPQSANENAPEATVEAANDEEDDDVFNDEEGDFKISHSQKGKPKVFYDGHG